MSLIYLKSVKPFSGLSSLFTITEHIVKGFLCFDIRFAKKKVYIQSIFHFLFNQMLCKINRLIVLLNAIFDTMVLRNSLRINYF